MSNPPDPTPAPEPSKRDAARAFIDAAILREIDLSEEIFNSAAKPNRATVLLREKITATILEGRLKMIVDADGLIAVIMGKSSGKGTSTNTGGTRKQNLLTEIGKVQGRAKRRFPVAGDPGRKTYFIGINIGRSRSYLLTSSRSLLVNLALGELPTQTAEDTAALAAAIDAYAGVKSTTKSAQSAVTQAHSDLAALVAEMAVARRDLQYAADILWPHDDPLNAAARAEFKLPLDRKLK